MAPSASTKYLTPSLHSSPVHVDPSASGIIVRSALAIEAACNVVLAGFMILQPYGILTFLSDSAGKDLSPLSASLMQWLGAFVLTVTTPLVLTIPNTKATILCRPFVFATQLAAETVLIPLMFWQGFFADTSEMSPSAMLMCGGNLVVPFIFRAYVLGWKPEWMGRYREACKEA